MEQYSLVYNLFADKKKSGTCLIASALLSELLKRKGITHKLMQGYWFKGDMYGRHYWVQTDDGIVYDIPADMLGLSCSVTTIEPTHLQRIDKETADEQTTLRYLELGYEIYTTKGIRALTKSAPGYIRKFVKSNCPV